MITACDIQGAGSPPNHHYVEFNQISNISGATITLRAPLQNDYLSTFPAYSQSRPDDEGGPATIYLLKSTWNAEQVWYGVTFTRGAASGDQVISLRKLRFIDCCWGSGDSNAPIPSLCKTIEFLGCDISPINHSIEIDKNVEITTFRNCKITNYATLLFQSSSIQFLNIHDCEIASLEGTPRNTIITNSIIGNMTCAPRSNGRMETLTLENCDVTSFSLFPLTFLRESISNYTYSEGTFTKANTGNNCPVWAVPGTKCVFNGNSGFAYVPPSFTILAVRGDAGQVGSGNIYIDTTLSLASLPTWTHGTLSNALNIPDKISPHPCPSINVVNCRGALGGWTQTGPVRAATKDQLVLTGNATTGYSQGRCNLYVFGTLTSLTINVLRAYTGANGSENLVLAGGYAAYDTSYAGATLSLSVDVKTAGIRSWSAGSWSGSAGGDSLGTINAGDWWIGFPYFKFDNDMSGDALYKQPIVIITAQTDQGIIEYPQIQYGAFTAVGNRIQ
jgi:hypothetical protein